MSRTVNGIFFDHKSLAAAKGYGKEKCYKCGKAFKLKDLYHIQRNNNGTKWYHRDCWNSLFL